MNRFFKVVLSLAVAWLPLVTASGQQEVQPSLLTLRQAVNVALEKNPLHKAAVADTKAASAEVREARSLLMPHLSFSETATRGDDPVYVFGSKLRQQRFTAADLALNKLNAPPPFGNFSTRFGGSWNLFDSFASWHGEGRAKQMNEAAKHQLDRTDQEIVFRVLSSYYDVLLAAKQFEVADQSVKTAKSIINSSQARFDSGLTVESDLLTAKVRLAARQEEAIRARNTLQTARSELNTAMGMPVESPFRFVEGLAEDALPIPTLQEIEKQALTNRPDLKRIASEEAAQRHNVAMAKSSFGPRVNAFAGWEMDNPTFAAGCGGNNWQGGIEVQFDIFQGGAKRAALSRQEALEEKAVAIKQRASDAVRLEVRRAYYDVETSRQQIEVARAAIAQAQESLRINQDRYDSGLTTITDLLGAEDATRRSQTDYWEAIYHFRTSYANLELATGNLNPQSPAVMP
ncbi:TolC family protein [Alloacidobacterium sp.]|uniref:TolC family protein n=1 Tax=Alloacidobacterium sp. TaxID=2951999 RepID=UPI002D736262|nr:TolC family protein [Alloacidobacterium sp.]HYK37292.1 TolC family protein [Alloacidobacterium sp.]